MSGYGDGHIQFRVEAGRGGQWAPVGRPMLLQSDANALARTLHRKAEIKKIRIVAIHPDGHQQVVHEETVRHPGDPDPNATTEAPAPLSDKSTLLYLLGLLIALGAVGVIGLMIMDVMQ